MENAPVVEKFFRLLYNYERIKTRIIHEIKPCLYPPHLLGLTFFKP